MPATTKMQGLTIAPCFWINHVLSKWLKEKFTPFWISKGLVKLIINEQCLIRMPIRQTSASKVNLIEVLQMVIN
jgi:hypothetical protein